MLELLQKTPAHRVNEKKKYCYLLNKLLYILFEAKVEYEQYAPDYLEVFIDMNDLEKKLGSLGCLTQQSSLECEENL
ncbi:hypothetical protein [Petroclostridium sp. X23]|uniref:hypothetical protein n=1 Tax=Petroclostridium sp. X23 TaxID=3045146 RepID=UPI0024AD9E40|nr:hypothetical protein [Petroclostridium sp. X23]WHH58842.1 hypothetical protein QKW49_24125 [Petroclostridium sp. X23]